MALIPWFLLLSLTCTMLVEVTHSAAHQDNRKVYIVYMGDKPAGEVSTTKSPSLHVNMLQNVVDSSINNMAQESLLLYSYKRSFNGFAAKLTEEEAQKMAGMDGVVSVFPSQKNKLHTTKSWDFIGFPQKVKRSTLESDVIVGVIDTGIWPESAGFSDAGFGPPPKKWKGECDWKGQNFTCNNKIIGARAYRTQNYLLEGDIASPRDSEGHGTHTASTAAGNLDSKASLYGLGSGTARGGVPSARIAVYKVLWKDGGDDADILAAFDDAIADGVDIISVSLGGQVPLDYFKSSVAIGAFHAFKNGILTSASAGNEGPKPMTVSNFAPWLLSVAATTIGRHFSTEVQLGNHQTYKGIVTNAWDLKDKFYPLIYGGDAPNRTEGFDWSVSRSCVDGSLDKNLVKNKIVLCDGTSGKGAINAGAAGVVLQGRTVATVIDGLPRPGSCLGLDDGSKILHYINATSNPTATIFKSKEIRDALSPYVLAFSSRGPNPVNPNILKPDLAAPGVYIVAAWPPIASISANEIDYRSAHYNIISGTSMACPHATGAAAYVKSFHPNWSPGAIHSALITTAKPIRNHFNADAEFAYGAGNINPTRAPYPGLVYDIAEVDYIKFLCAQGYVAKSLQIITGDKKASCSSKSSHGITLSDQLNYPSFALPTSTLRSINGIFHRTVTNVGSPKSTYKAQVSAPPGLKISVNPSVLSFTSLGQKLSFHVTIEGSIDKSMASASLVWDDGTFQVRSPIVVHVVF